MTLGHGASSWCSLWTTQSWWLSLSITRLLRIWSLWLNLVCVEVLMHMHDTISSHGWLYLASELVLHARIRAWALMHLRQFRHWIVCRATLRIGSRFLSLIADVHQVKHLHTSFLTQMTHVACVTERKVVVMASLANPVTSSLRICYCSFIIFELSALFIFLRQNCRTFFVRRISSRVRCNDCIKCWIFFQSFNSFRFSSQVGIYLEILEFTILLHFSTLKFKSRRGFFLLMIRLE